MIKLFRFGPKRLCKVEKGSNIFTALFYLTFYIYYDIF